ncbi:uncharacterized protein TNCV_4872751 [Trichonephila clavipes]|nr:uncharacterized protein TNCV_4872751 [Trichonephila clavipes]
MLANNEGRGRKKIMSSITERRVIHQVKIDPKISAPKIAASTSNTLATSYLAIGFCRNEHILKPQQFWNEVIFSDESKFNIFGSDGRRMVRRKPNTSHHTIPTVKHGGESVMVDYLIGRCKSSKCISLCSSLILFCAFVACCGGLIYFLRLSRHTASVIGLGLIGIVCLALSFTFCRWGSAILQLWYAKPIYQYDSEFHTGQFLKQFNSLDNACKAAVAEWYRYRTVACFVTGSIPVPLKTRRVGQRCTLNLSRAETSSRWCGVVVRRGGASSGVVHVT